MISKHISLFSAITVVLLIAGCKGDTGPAGPSLTGNMTGFVTLFQSDGSGATDKSGVTVSIQGTSLSATTDSTGKWSMNGLTTGSYTVTYTKVGYGMTEQQGVQFVGGDEAYFLGKILMSEPPNFSVSLDPIKTVADSNAFVVWFKVNAMQWTEVYGLIAVGTDSNVNGADPTKYLFSTMSLVDNFLGTPDTSAQEISISESTLQAAGFISGEPAYVVVYPLGTKYSSYLDHTTGRTAYTSLGAPSSVIRLIVP